MATHKRLFNFSSLTIILAGALLLLTFYYQKDENNEVQNATGAIPDSYASNIDITRYLANGDRHSMIRAPRMSHYSESKSTTIKMPYIELYKSNRSPWVITAQHGSLRDDTELSEFWEDVIIKQAASAHNSETIIKTDYMRYHPEQNTAMTHSPVSISQPHTKIHGKGLHANLNNSLVTIEHKVKVKYVP